MGHHLAKKTQVSMEFFSRIIYKWVDFPASLGLLGLIIGGQTACGGTMNVGQRKPFSWRVDPIVPEMEGTDSPKTAIWCYNVGVRKPWDSGLLVSGSHAHVGPIGAQISMVFSLTPPGFNWSLQQLEPNAASMFFVGSLPLRCKVTSLMVINI